MNGARDDFFPIPLFSICGLSVYIIAFVLSFVPLTIVSHIKLATVCYEQVLIYLGARNNYGIPISVVYDGST